MKIQINRNALKATLHVAPKYDIRYYLCGAHIRATATHTIVSATDGHMAMMYRHEAENEVDEDGVDLIVPLSIVQTLTKGKPPTSIPDIEIFKHDDLKWRSTIWGHEDYPDIVFKEIVANFPFVENAIPRETSGQAAHFNNDLVSRMFKAAFCVEKSCTVDNVLLFQNGSNAAVVRNMRDSNFIGIIMPMGSCEQPDSVVQDWAIGMKDKEIA